MAVDKENYAHLIRQLTPINELPPQIQNEVIKKCNVLSFRKGKYIFKQGERDEYSYYLLEGEIEFYDGKLLNSVVTVGTDRARYAMAQLQPRQFSAKAKINSVVMQISRDSLDKLMVLQENGQNDDDDESSTMEVEEVNLHELEEEELDWMTKMLQSELFSRMPTANIHQLFALLEPIEFKAGDTVIRQGDVGEHYYIIQEGKCQVSRKADSGGKEIKLAVLSAGDSFGEEALISETTRNATVSMITEGILMQLSKDNFIELIKKPTVQSLSYGEASILVAAGAAEWVDVRFKNEFESSAIEGSRNIPLNILRAHINELSQEKQYVLYCDTGGRSSTGAFVLANYGFDVSYLDGGLFNYPEALDDSVVNAGAEDIDLQSVTQLRDSSRKLSSKSGTSSDLESITKGDLDPEIKASLLEAELARTNMKMEDVEKIKQRAASKSEKEMQEEVERRLAEERAKIEAAKKEAEQEAKRLREREAGKLKKMREEAEKRMQAEKQKLEEVYNRNAEEMAKLQKIKQEAEAHMRREKEKLEKQAKQAMKSEEEAERIKHEIEKSKRLLEEESLKQRQVQEEMEEKIRAETKAKLEAERRRMAEEFAKNQSEVEQARREQEAAAAARKAAKLEADRIIAEFKIKHAEDRAAEEAKLKAERMKLEEEQRKIKEALEKIEQVKKEAETVKQKASVDAKRLRARRENKEITHSRFVRKKLEDDIKAAESRINRANKDIQDVKHVREKAERARKSNQQNLEKQREIEQQLSADLEEFRSVQEKGSEAFSNITSQLDYMKRIKEKAERAKMDAEKADQNLFSDIKSLLKKKKE